jgi:hypothetical protein
VTGAFLDLAKLVASDTSRRSGGFDDLASDIGRDVYADLNGWHLFLKDMGTVPGGPKMADLLAQQLGATVRVGVPVASVASSPPPGPNLSRWPHWRLAHTSCAPAAAARPGHVSAAR